MYDKNWLALFSKAQWCPLFGGFPVLDEPETTDAMECISIITEARLVWGLVHRDCVLNRYGISIFSGITFSLQGEQTSVVVHKPNPDAIEEIFGYPAFATRTARAVMYAENLFEAAHMFSEENFGLAKFEPSACLTRRDSSDNIIRMALSLLDKHDKVDKRIPHYTLIAGFAIHKAARALAMILEAGGVSASIQTKHMQIGTADPIQSATRLLKLAQQMEARASLYEMQPDAERGKKVLIGGKKAHENLYGTQTEKDEKWRKYQAEIDRLHDKHPDWSYEALKKGAAKAFNVCTKTIARRTSNPHTKT